MSNIFLPYTSCAIKFARVVVRSIVAESVFCGTLRIICHINFKRDSINFHNQRRQPVKYQHLGSAPFKCSRAGDTFGHDNTDDAPKNVVIERNDDEENHTLDKDKTSEVADKVRDHSFKPCSDERQNGFKLFKTKTKQF